MFLVDFFSADGMLAVLVGGLITFLSTWILRNNELREGITKTLLKKLNKTSIKVIDLKNHKLFGLLQQRKNSLATFIIDDPIKMSFYKSYVDTVFTEMEESALNIIQLNEEKDSLEHTAMQEIYAMQERIEVKVDAKLNIPKKVEKSFTQWRAMMSAAFNQCVKEILHDDLMESNYLLAYRILDVYGLFVIVLLNTGAAEMSRLNGAFKGLEESDIINKTV